MRKIISTHLIINDIKPSIFFLYWKITFYIGKVKEVNIKSIKYTALTEKTDHEIDAMEGVGLKFASDEVVSTFKVCYLHGFSDIATVADYISYSN